MTTVFASGKKPFLEMKAQIAEQMKLSDTMNTKISAIEKLNMKLADKLDAQNTAIAGVGNSVSKVSSDIKAGRDVNTSTVNDTKIFEIQEKMYKNQIDVWRYLFYAICVIVGNLIAILSWIIRALFKEMSNARYYQVSVAKISQNGEFDKIMKEKKEYEKERSIINKAKKLFRGDKNVA